MIHLAAAFAVNNACTIPAGKAETPPGMPSGAFPDATTTGVPRGMVLKKSAGLKIKNSGAVIAGLDITGVVSIVAKGVTLKNCRINANGGYFAIDSDGYDTTIQDCEIFNAQNSAVLCKGGQVLRCDMHHCDNGVTTQGGDLIQDCYIHDLGYTPTAHVDGVSIQAGSGQIVRHNHIESWDTSCVFIKDDFTPISEIVIDGNRLINTPGKMTAFCVYSDARGDHGGISGVQFINNIMQRGNGGYASIERNSPVWINNMDYLTGRQIARP